VSGQNHGPLRGANQLERFVVRALRGRKIGPVPAHLRLSRFPIKLAGALLRVLGDVDQHRPRPSGLRHVHRFANGVRDFIRAGHKIIVLGDGLRNAGDVGFLKRVRAKQLAAHLPRDAHDR
jgi:hypothetical protein